MKSHRWDIRHTDAMVPKGLPTSVSIPLMNTGMSSVRRLRCDLSLTAGVASATVSADVTRHFLPISGMTLDSTSWLVSTLIAATSTPV